MVSAKRIMTSLPLFFLSVGIILLGVFTILPQRTYAAPDPNNTSQTDSTTSSADSSTSNRPRSNDCKEGLDPEKCGITRYIVLFINVLSAALGVIVTGVIIVAGIQYSASGSNPQATAAAKKRIPNAVLALVFFVAMYGFLQWIVPGGVL